MVYRNRDLSENIAGFSSNQGFRDRRARLSPKPAAFDLVLGSRSENNILNPIRKTNGMMWPYSPTINESVTVNYEEYDLVHTIQPLLAYKNTGLKNLQVTGTWTSQTQEEARYSLASIHFLRTVTKMFFGATGQNEATDFRGTPPPVLMFNAYGNALYHNVPVLVKEVSIDLPNDVDYVRVNLGSDATTEVNETDNLTNINNSQIPQDRSRPNSVSEEINAWVPTRFSISLTLTVQNPPKRLRQFNLNEFREGNLIKKGGWT